MGKIIITRDTKARACPFCGLNTSLLPKEQRVSENGQTYCRQCKKDKMPKLTIKPKDYYEISFDPKRPPTLENVSKQVHAESICNQLPRIEIAHLHGEFGREDDMYLDFFYDETTDTPYFRLCMIDDDDPWWGTESYTYLEPSEISAFLNKNGIHIFDGMTEKTWKSYILFENN